MRDIGAIDCALLRTLVSPLPEPVPMYLSLFGVRAPCCSAAVIESLITFSRVSEPRMLYGAVVCADATEAAPSKVNATRDFNLFDMW